MEEKAHENLRAAHALAALSEPCWNAVANRAYYAAYHAAWSALQEKGEVPPKAGSGRSDYYGHGTDENSIFTRLDETKVLTRRQQAPMKFLNSMRIKADYQEGDVDEQGGTECLEKAESVLEKLL